MGGMQQMASMAPTLAGMAGRAMDLLEEMAAYMRRQLELQESTTKNYLSAGTRELGGNAGTGFTPILEVKLNRRGLSIQNLSASGGPNLTVGLGTKTPQVGKGIVLAPGMSWDGRLSGEVWLGSVTLVSTATCTWSGLEA
jgi:hypothetical protein